MNENLKDQDSVNTTGYNTVSPIGDVEKEKFMELLKNGPESKDIIDDAGMAGGRISFLLNDRYNNMVITIDFYQKPLAIVLSKNGLKSIQEYIREDFGKRWEELAYRYFPCPSLAGGIHCTN